MRIGIVCEGPTDRHAIVNFVRASLTDRGIRPEFVAIQPEIDRTNPSGWHAVLNWLLNNPPAVRLTSYLGGGLFAEGLSAKSCDLLILQIDADNLSERGFQNWNRTRLGYTVKDMADPIGRGNEIRLIIRIAGKFDMLSDRDSRRHLPAPAVESTETWCIAAFRPLRRNPEYLSGPALCQEFMTALHESEGRPIQSFTHINKSPDRRRRYCGRHSSGFRRLEAQCRHYQALVESIVRQAART